VLREMIKGKFFTRTFGERFVENVGNCTGVYSCLNVAFCVLWKRVEVKLENLDCITKEWEGG
jgi:hypothetical protein